MKISVTTEIKNFKGEQIKHSDETVATFRSIVCEVLSMPQASDRGKDSTHIYKMYRLGQRINDEDLVELNLEERSLIKERVTASDYLIPIKGKIYDMLEESVTKLETVRA